MVIGSLDKTAERTSKRQKYYDSVMCNEGGAGEEGVNNSDTDLDMEVSDNEDNDSYDELEDLNESDDESCRNMMKFPTVARECDRYGVSDAAGAAILLLL